MNVEPHVRLVPQTDTSATTYAARNEGLRQENLLLKAQVVQLSAIIAKNVASQK